MGLRIFLRLTFSIIFSTTLLLHAEVPVKDFSGVYHATVDSVFHPKTVEELRQIVVATKKQVAIVGGNYSMGGQTWHQDGIVIDMSSLKAITHFDASQKTVTVQAGALWRDVQTFLLSYNLTVGIMQSFNDFSVGGSLSVNVHGRDLRGQIIGSVQGLTIMLHDGSLVKADRSEHYDLFKAVIGGYGACGIIVDATLKVDDNCHLERTMTFVPVSKFNRFFREKIKGNKKIAFFNANIYGPNYDQAVSIVWSKTDKPLTIQHRMHHGAHGLVPHELSMQVKYALQQALSNYSYTHVLRGKFDSILMKYTNPVVWRSYAMSYPVALLDTPAHGTSKILQEYFVPVEHFEKFVDALRSVFKEHNVKALNVSIRYVPRTMESVLSYAAQHSFAFVCYVVIDNNPRGHAYAQQWTRKLIDAVLALQGTYYLPYHLFASSDQCIKAYPRYFELRAIKNKYDPAGRFNNSLISFFEKTIARSLS